MKLRIHKNVIRLRLSQPEVETIAHGRSIVERLEIGGDPQDDFHYTLIPSEEADEISVEFVQHNLKVFFPKHQAKEWADTDEVGVSQQLSRISILIEKDFQCLHKRPGEDETVNFINPLA